MTLRFSTGRRWGTTASVLVLLAVGPTRANVPPEAQALLTEGRAALAAYQGVTAQTKFEQAIARGTPRDELRALIAHAYLLQGRRTEALEMARADRVPLAFAAYAARMRAAALGGDRAAAGRELALATQLAPNDSFAWSDTARFRRAGGDAGGALAAAARAVALDPNNVEALILSAALIRDRYGLVAALPWYDRALVVQPNNIDAMLDRAATLGDLGRARDMLDQTRAVLAIAPSHPRAFYLQAVMAARAQDWDLARALLYKIGGQLGDFAALRMLAGSVEIAQGNAEQALVELRPLVDRQPNNLAARRLLAAALRLGGDDQGVVDTLRPFAGRGDADPYILTMVGRAYERLGDRIAAAQFLDRASQPLRATPGPLGWGSGPVARLRLLSVQGKTGEATAYAAQLERHSPGAAWIMVLSGDSLAFQGRWREAADTYQRAADLKFDEATMLRLVEALQRAGNGEGAVAVIDLFRMQHPQSRAAALLASDSALSAKQWGRAGRLLDTLRQQSGNRDATLLNNLAWVRMGQGQPGEAVKLARAAYALTPNSAPVAGSYGWFASAVGDKMTAVALLEKAVALAPEITAYRARLAKARSGS
jgi:tetratricopeptide (TPR) repeat protein